MYSFCGMVRELMIYGAEKFLSAKIVGFVLKSAGFVTKISPPLSRKRKFDIRTWEHRHIGTKINFQCRLH